MFDRLDDLLIRYQQINEELADPDVVNDQRHFRTLMKEQSDLTPLVEKYTAYKKANQTIEDSLDMLSEENDPEMRELIKEDLTDARGAVQQLTEELKVLLLPKDPLDHKNVIVEIRAGTGGDEAALFAADLYRMYTKYADRRNWKTEIISANENGIGGFKEVVFQINGEGAYSRLKYESGVHRVQRVPETESGGRIHTARASGNGGQCVNTTDSAVRLTHYPTGIVIYSQTEKSQLQNKEKAFRLLRAKLLALEVMKRDAEEASMRRNQIGSGDRSEKIRTYNFPQSRVTDHRIKLTLHTLSDVMNGDLDTIIDSLIAADQAEKLAQMDEDT